MSTARTIALVPTLAAFLLVAWSRDVSQIAASFNLDLLLILALLALPLVALLTDAADPAAAHSLRLAMHKLLAQLPLAFTVLAAALAAGSLNLFTISLQQSAGVHRWLAFHDPFNLFAFYLSILIVHGILKARPAMEVPYRYAESPPAPPHIPFANASLFLLCAVQTSLWLGAWYDPFGVVCHLEHLSHDAAIGPAAVTNPPIAAAANALGLLVFLGKALGLLVLQKSMARHLPRYRFAELLPLIEKILLPASVFNFLAAAAYFWLIEPLLKFQNITQAGLAILGLSFPLALGLALWYGRLTTKPAP
jgi:NADH:ubiquinone oxidoreductase subunit H